MRKDFPGLISSVKDELILVMDERLKVFRFDLKASRLRTREVSFRQFDVY